MTVREKRGRQRYILFEIQGEEPIPRKKVIFSLNRQTREIGFDRREARLRVIFFRDRIGIVRCSHLFKDDVIGILNSIEVDGRMSKTLRTSGTLKTLRDWLREKRGIIVPGKARRMKNKIRGKVGRETT
ncbi:MAG: hypothetical protein KAU14_00720 [Thermoplasmata archaeon]|nr:hypothetical protein [Thermoplasmata archaeon]